MFDVKIKHVPPLGRLVPPYISYLSYGPEFDCVKNIN